MNTKSKLINKLLEVAKKHRILTYPVLALVAVISVIHYFFSWSNGAGKRVVAVVMVLVMLVSQSYFLTSSATALVDDENANEVQAGIIKENGEGGLIDAENGSNDETVTDSAQATEGSKADSESNGTSGGDGQPETGSTETTVNSEVSGNPAATGNGEEIAEGVTVQDEGADMVTPYAEEDGNENTSTNTKKFSVNFHYSVRTGDILQTISNGSVEITFSVPEDAPDYNICENATFIEKVSNMILNFNQKGCYVNDLVNWYRDASCTGDSIDITAFPVDSGITDLYCKLTLVKYFVAVNANVNANDGGYATDADPTGEDDSWLVEKPEQGDATIHFTGVSKVGHQLSGYKLTGSSYVSTAGITKADAVAESGADVYSFSVKLSGDSAYNTVEFVWTEDTYRVSYQKERAMEPGTYDPVFSEDVKYGNLVLPSGGDSEYVTEKPGYEFKGWSTSPTGRPGDSDYFTAGNSVGLVEADWYKQYKFNKDDPVKLYPVYEYQGIKINEDPKLTFEYKKVEKKSITASYESGTTPGDGRFKYELVNAEDGEKLWSSYGIMITTGSELVFDATQDGGPKQTTVESGTEKVSIRITDTYAPKDYSKVVEFTITVNRREVTLVLPDDFANKSYDGTTDLKLKKEYKKDGGDTEGIVNTNLSWVKAVFDIDGSCYNDKNVGDRSLTLNNVRPYIEDDRDAEKNYTIKNVPLMGKISPKRVLVDPKVWDGKAWVSSVTIRAGEASPNVKVEPIDGDSGLLEGDTLGEITYTSNPERPPKDTEKEKEYRIQVKEQDGSNYKIVLDSDATFKVIMESPDDKYVIKALGGDGSAGKDNWYLKGARIDVKEGTPVYNTVRMSESENGPLMADSTVTKEGLNEVWIQLYSDPSQGGTGAYTSWTKVTIKVDGKEPEYLGYSLRAQGGEFYNTEGGVNEDIAESVEQNGLFFPTKGLLSFGSYFKQNVEVTIKYRDDENSSGLNRLYYGLSSDALDNYAMFQFTDDGPGVKSASFTLNNLVLDKVGEIYFCAEDFAGNRSAVKVLTRDHISGWCVEGTGPDIEQYGMYVGEEHLKYLTPASVDRKKYYSHSLLEAKVSDEVAGIYSVKWKVNGDVLPEERISDTARSYKEWTFRKAMEEETWESGEYTVSAIVTDNAGNEQESESMTFLLDNQAPVIVCEEYRQWVQSKDSRIDFTITDDASGIDNFKIVKVEGDNTIEITRHFPEISEDGIWSCYFEPVQKGEYRIIAYDNAGNRSEYPILLTTISDQVPECPAITVTPELASGIQWYNKAVADKLKVVIGSVDMTPDETPVITYYQLWEEGETAYNKETIVENPQQIDISKDGIYHLRAWAESMTGVSCKDTHSRIIKIDREAPDIQFTTKKGKDSASMIVEFTITDATSGVDEATVKVRHGLDDVVIKGEKKGNHYSGSFEITQTGNYYIEAADFAGNKADVSAFSPMSMKVNAVKNITTTGATLGAQVIRGSSPVKSATLSYRKYTENTYRTLGDNTATWEANGNVSLLATLSGLEKATSYVYKVTATSQLGEVLEYEGYFRTLSDSGNGISITGIARYADEKEGNITVGLFSGYECIMATEIKAGNQFTFSNVPNGNYSIVATDGRYTKTLRMLVEDGMVIYPTTSIDLVLSGKNTSVVLTTQETPNVTADNLDSIFDIDPVNYTVDDKKLVDTEGGVVEFKLCATLMAVSAVSPEEITAMYAATGKNKVVGAYLDLSLYKVVTDKYGMTEQSRVTQLGNGAKVSVTIPLGDLAGKPGLEVIRIHDNGDRFLGTYLYDEDSNPSTYTISTDQFSTYAVLYDVSGVDPARPAETIEEGTAGPSQNGTPNSGILWGNGNEIGEDDKKPIEPDTSTRASSAEGSSIGSLRSSSSAKTGDAAPVAAMGGMMIISVAGFFVLRKRLK